MFLVHAMSESCIPSTYASGIEYQRRPLFRYYIRGGGAWELLMGLATGSCGALRASRNVAISDVDWKVRSRFAEKASYKRESIVNGSTV